jgi:hypothetical protein
VYFYKNDLAPVSSVSGVSIKSKNNINILGVIFGIRHSWSKKASCEIFRQNKSINAIKLNGMFDLRQVIINQTYSTTQTFVILPI